MGATDPRVVRQLRRDVDDVYRLLDSTNCTVTSTAATQRRHSSRLEEIQQSLDLQSGRLERIEGTQQQILDLLRGRPGGVEESSRRLRSPASTSQSQVRVAFDGWIPRYTGPDAVAVDAIGRYTDAGGQVSVVSSCDIYQFIDGLLTAITSYAVELPPGKPPPAAVTPSVFHGMVAVRSTATGRGREPGVEPG